MTTTAHRTDGKPRRLARLLAYIDMMAAEETKSGFTQLGRDLRSLHGLLKAVAKEVPAAVTVPEWDNHLDDDGHPVGLGDACATYHAWVEDAGIDHDGATQVAEVAVALRRTLNALDRIADAN